MQTEFNSSLEQSKPYTTQSKAHHSDVMAYCVSFYLKEIKSRQNERERLLERFLKLSDTVGGIDYSTNLGVQTSTENHFEDKVIARMEAYQAYLDVVEQSSDIINHAKKLIAQIEDGEILWLHYVDGLRWSVIALRRGVSRQWLHVLRLRATKELYNVMPEEYRRYAIPDAMPNIQNSF